MIRMCAWCKQVFGEKEPLEDKSETHGMCDACYSVWQNDRAEKVSATKEGSKIDSEAR